MTLKVNYLQRVWVDWMRFQDLSETDIKLEIILLRSQTKLNTA